MKTSGLFLALLFLVQILPVHSVVLTYADYAQLPVKSMMVISPSGSKLAYRQVSNGRDLLVLLDLIEGKVIRAIRLDEIDPDNAYFIDDNRLILVASQNRRLLGYRGRHDISVAFSVDIETGKIHQLLTAGVGIYSGQSSVGVIVGVSEDHKYAYMPAWKDAGHFNLFKVHLTKNLPPRKFKKGTSDTINFFMGEKGKLLARERFNNEDDLHRLEARLDDEWVTIFTEKTEIRHVAFVGVTPDRKSLVMQKKNSENGRWAYYTILLKNGDISSAIFSRDDRDVEQVLTDINNVVYGVRFSGFEPSYEFFDNKLNKRIKGINAVLPDVALRISDYTPDWSTIVLKMSGDGGSGQYIRYQKGSLDSLAHIRPNITEEHVNPVIETSFKARDGLVIPTLLTQPKGKATVNLPAIMLPHGGPESYDRIRFDWLSQYFASQGYLVIQPQFRGSSGFGSEHLHKGRGEWGRKMQDDLTDAITHLAKEGKVDPKRVCIVGASYGGYAALAGAAITPELYKCAVSINGVSDIPSMLKGDRRKYGSDHWVVSYWDKVISNGNIEEDHLENISPINSVKNITAPVLLIHSERDMVVPFEQSEDMFDEMEDNEKQVTFVELEKGNHYLSNANNRAKALEAIDKFLKEHL